MQRLAFSFFQQRVHLLVGSAPRSLWWVNQVSQAWFKPTPSAPSIQAHREAIIDRAVPQTSLFPCP